MKNTILKLGAIAGATLWFAGCSKEPLNHLTPEETRIYVTNFDSVADFSSYKTYSLADSVAVIDNGQHSKALSASDQAYIAAVNKYMQERGYVLTAASASPDLALTVNRIYNTATSVVTYNDYYDNYYDSYWDPYYWGYGGYGYYVPYGYSVYQVTEGAVSIDMLDLKNAKSNGKIGLVWNGLVRGEGIFAESNADAQVKALFDQSTYLKANN